MKKLLFLFTALAALASCSSDDSPSASFNSSLSIDGTAFKPTNASQSKNTSEGYTVRNFNLVKGTQSLTITLGVPLNASESGTYSFGPVNVGQRYANGGYTNGSGYFTLLGEVVKLEAKSNNVYKITLVNTELQNINTVVPMEISGSFEGTFTTVEN